jgi:hypothetical protein
MGFKILKEVCVGAETVKVYMLDEMGEVLEMETTQKALDFIAILNRNSDNNTTYKLVSCKTQDGTKV